MTYFIRNNPDQTTIEQRVNSVDGMYNGAPYHDSNSRGVRTSWKVRSATLGTHDHQSPTDWYVNGGTVSESPLRARRTAYDGNGSITMDVIDTFYMSRDQPDPYVWDAPDFLGNMQNNVDRVDTEILLKLANLRDGSRAQLANSLLDAVKTLDMLASVVIPPVKALLKLRSGNLIGALREVGLTPKSIVKSVPNQWLAYQYGWKPLLSDIYHVNEKLKMEISKPLRLNVRHSRTLKSENTTNVESRKISGRSGMGIVADYIPSGLSNIDASGLLNPVSIAWEAVPFSFVFDWFIPLGNTFQALTATADLQFVSGYRNSKFVDSVTRFNDGNPPQQLISQGKYNIERYKFNRVSISGFPLPKIYENTNPFSTPRILNAAALLGQLFTRR